MDVTGRVSHASVDSSRIVTLASDDGTDTVKATALGDLMSAPMQAKSASEALSPKEKRNTVRLQPLTQRHRNTSKHYVSLVNAVDVHKVVSYSDCYGRAPRSCVVDVNASGISFLSLSLVIVIQLQS